MSTSVFRRSLAWVLIVALTFAPVSQSVAITLSTKPLAATTASVVRPNLMYVLDDSGSMGWDYTPDYVNDATVTDPLNAGTGPAGSSGDTGSVTLSCGAATCAAPGGSVATITAVGGNSYLEQPTVVIEGGGGTGATATAVWNSSTKKITSVTVNNGGSGYTSKPFVTFVGKLSSAAWGLCWGTTATSNQGGTPKDTSSSPQCTSNTQVPYATSAINYQYYDPAVRYEAPMRADGTRYANAPSPWTAVSSDGFLSGATKNLTNAWTHEVWCNSSTAAPTMADPTAGGKCREVSNTSGDTLYPNATYNFRKTYNGPATYFTMDPVEYCTNTDYTTCVRSTVPTVVGVAPTQTTYNIPSKYRWCSYYNPNSKSFGGCQGRRDWAHYIPNYLGGWVSTGQAGVQATANLVISSSLTAGQILNRLTVGTTDVINGAQFEVGTSFDYSAGSRVMNTATDVAQAVCETIRANTPTTGYSCAQTGATVTIQASIAGTTPNGLAVLATGPTTAAEQSVGVIRVLTAPANYRVNSITVTRAATSPSPGSTVSLIGSAVVADGNTANAAQAICQAINSGPNQGTYIARSGDPADPTLDWGLCRNTVDAYVGIKRVPSDVMDNDATITVAGPAVGSQTEGSITINSTGDATVIKDVLLNGVSVLTSKPLNYADGTQTSTIATNVASKISITGCTATATGNTVTIAGTCSGTLTIDGTGNSATGVFRVTTSGNTNKGDLGGIQVNGKQLVGHLGNSLITNGSAVSTNASTLTTQLNNSTSANQTVGGVTVNAHGFSATSAANGSNYDITVTAPAGNTYNNQSFTFQAGTASAAGSGTAPTWTFPITGATTDNRDLTSITCGGTVAVSTRNTGTTTSNVNYVENLAIGASTNGLNGKTGAGGASGYSYACSNASMTSPQYRCTVTGPAGAPACSNLAITKGAGITLSTTTPAAVGGTAGGANKWTFTVTDATTSSKEISTIRCGTSSSSPLMASFPAANTGSAATGYASRLEVGLDDSSASNWDNYGDLWSGGSSSCTPNDGAGTVSCTYRKKDTACINPYIGVTGGLSVSSQNPSTTGSLSSGNDLTFTVSGANAINQTVTEVSCAHNTVTTTPSTSDSFSGTTRAERLAAAIPRSDRLDTNYWNFGSSSCNASGTTVTCALKPETGYCPTSGASDGGLIVTVSSGMSVNTPTFNSGTGKWEFTISGADASGETVNSVRCRPNALGATATTGSTTISGSAKVQRLENLRGDLNGQTTGDYSISCPTAATDAAGFACEISSTGTCTSSTIRMYGSASSGITITPNAGSAEVTDSGRQFGTFVAGSGATSPTWTFDIVDATTANETISAISCGGTSILPSSAPSTGTAPASTGYQRMNNLTGASAGPPATPGSLVSNGYTWTCNAATSTSTQPSCTLTGPVGVGACGATAGSGFVINADSSITFGTVSFTDGSSSSSATEDFAPYLSTVSAFSGGRAAQGTTIAQIASIATGPVTVSTTNFTNSVAATSAIPTNATGTAPDILAMSGGEDPDTAQNHWTGVGIFKRVDIVPAVDSYTRASGRTDCTGATCTYNEEMQNFANWYMYYRTRMQMMKSATSIAFSQLDGNYRVGFDNICQATGTTLKRSVAQFVDTGGEVANQRTNWWSQLTGTSPSCATPLRAETAKIGRYFAGKLTTPGDPIQYSCQQNFMLLVTDGYWNETEPSGTSILAGDIGNTDYVQATAPRPYFDGVSTNSCPATGTSRGSTEYACRTLADIAWYYYANDIRSFSKDVLVTTATAHGLTPGQAVSISEVVSSPPLTDSSATFNGDVVAHVINSTQFRYEARDKTTKLVRDPGTYTSGGRVKAAGIDVAISSMTYVDGLFSNQNNSASLDVAENNAITGSDDTNQHQHMNFFAMGLGIDGVLEYRSDYQTAGLGDYRDIVNGTRDWPKVANLDPTGVDDLWHATVNGHGKYFSARNLPNVVAGLREALTKIGARVGSAAAAATSNLQPVEGDNFAYVASYATLDWTGDLQSRSIDVTTGAVSASTACTTSGSGCQWSFQTKLDNMTWSARRLFLAPNSNASGDPLRDFNWGNLSASEQASMNPSGLSQYAALAVSNPSDITAENLVNFLRGFRGLEQDGASTHAQIWRFRTHVLGDIVNTQPEFVKAPSRKYSDAGYSAFKTAQAARKPVVFVSAQDGMLHAINAHTSTVTVRSATVQPGEEMWAYVPKQALGTMKSLADVNYTNNHRYFVDGPIITGDVNFGGGDSDWHTILIAGLGAGGKSYFALDITDPTNPLYLWEISESSTGFANLGYSFGNPVIGKLPGDSSWAVFFTSGYNNADGQGYMFAVNPKTGAMKTGFPLRTDFGVTNATWAGSQITFTVPSHGYSIGTNVTITGVTPAGYNGSYTITAVTADTFTVTQPLNPGAWSSGGSSYDGRPRNLGRLAAWVDDVQTNNKVQYIYAGDLLGDLWRFDLDKDATGHTGTAVFRLAHFEEGGIEQPITTKPQLTIAPNSSGTRIVFVGTGKYVENSDLTNTDVQAIYAVKDTLGAANLGGSTQQTFNPTTDQITVSGSPVNAFLGRRLITTRTDGSTVKWVDEYGTEVPGRAVCPGTSSTLSAGDSCTNTDDTAMDWDVYGGWYVKLPDTGERVNVDPRLSQGTLVVASNVPGATSCTAGGSAWINFFDYKTGLAIEGNKASRYTPALVVGITVIKLSSGETKVIVTRADYKQETLKVPVQSSGSFLGKRSLWREFEAY